MKILIVLTSLSRHISGVQRHGFNLARCLLMRNDIKEVHLVIAFWQHGVLQSIEPIRDNRLHLHTVKLSNDPLQRNWWYYTKLPRLATELGVDVVHLTYPLPVGRRGYQCPVVVSLHDVYPYDVPDNFGFPKVLFNKAILRQCMQAADAIACVSKSTRGRLEHIYPQIARSKATVICNCVESQSHVSAHSPVPRWAGEPFLLCVAQHRPNKNLLLLLGVFRRLLSTKQINSRTRLVIVGVPGPQTKLIQQFMSVAQLMHRVVLLTGLHDDELQWCYRNCGLLVAPSVVEGFGLPVAEALLAGCRVICSDIPAFREIGGNHCEYIPLDKDAELAFTKAIRTGILHPRPRSSALPQFSAKRIAEQYCQLYSALLNPVPLSEAFLLESRNSSSGVNTSLWKE